MHKLHLDFDSAETAERFMAHLLTMPNGKGITIIIPGTEEEAVISKRGWPEGEKPVPPPIIKQCDCETKATDVKGMRLLFVRRDCPLHGQHWQA